MQKVWTVVIGWLAGRKTYFLALLMVVVVAFLMAGGRISASTGYGVALIFCALFMASFRSALERHQQEVIAQLQSDALVARDILAHNARQAVHDALAAAMSARTLASEVKAEQAATDVEKTTGEACLYAGGSR